MELPANQAAAEAGQGKTVIGWALDREQRKELLQQFPPKFDNVVADHVTLAAKAKQDAALPCERLGEIVGRVDDGEGVEALVVAIDDSTDRPDGSIYHITWSLGEGRRARESNNVIARLGWTAIDLPMPVRLIPSRWP
ncbi:hypothetical protein ACFQRC_10815 [Enterovirga sp. GCM10030262]|uniref:hypothetical protein n=1 Tax=Enterovirga sp. GCM10030262 TaxID=3273391 RepID=UPI003620F712